jgi:hypothetical protein
MESGCFFGNKKISKLIKYEYNNAVETSLLNLNIYERLKCSPPTLPQQLIPFCTNFQAHVIFQNHNM